MNELKNAVDKAIGRCMTVEEWEMVEDFCDTDAFPSIQCIVDECF